MGKLDGKVAVRVADPAPRDGQPEEIASVALFLASDDSRHFNGTELVADGRSTVI
jgi:NAD(P)-dependent dehydrogenase (short-subunit alcohol dehydrogenase family)